MNTFIDVDSAVNILTNHHLFLFVTATRIETETLYKSLTPIEGLSEVKTSVFKSNTYTLARLGIYNIVHVECNSMGMSNRDAVITTVLDAIDCWNPDGVIMVGIAFGKDKRSQKIGDVLVIQSVVAYENMRVSTRDNSIKLEPRSHNVESGAILLDRFKNARLWEHILPNEKKPMIHVGTLLTGEKLVDNDGFKMNLFDMYPLGIGGDMEGYGVYTASLRRSIPEWIVIKGICDWGDGKKHINKKRNQEIAANAAVSLCYSVFSNQVFMDLAFNTKRIADGLSSENEVSELRNPILKCTINKNTTLRLKYIHLEELHQSIDHPQFVLLTPALTPTIFREDASLILENKIPDDLLPYVPQKAMEYFYSRIYNNDSLNEYMSEWERNIQAVHAISISFGVANTGTAKANDIVVKLSIPDNLIIVDKSNLDSYKKQFRSVSDPLDVARNNKIIFEKSRINENAVPGNFDGLFNIVNHHNIEKNVQSNYEKKNSIILHHNSLLQGLAAQFEDKYYIIPAQSGEYFIDVSIICEEFPHFIYEKLKIIIE